MIAAKPLRPIKRSDYRKYRDDILGFSMGREALHFALANLTTASNPHVLAPAYFCNSAIALSARAGVQFTFYPTSDDVLVRLDVIKAHLKTDQYDAVIINHLFGHYPPDRDAIYRHCHAAGIIVIDDMCHCPAPLFRVGADYADNYDIRIFSFRKFMSGVVGGGAMIHPRFAIPAPLKRLHMPLSARLRHFAEYLIMQHGPPSLYRILKKLRGKPKLADPLENNGGHAVISSMGRLPIEAASILGNINVMDAIAKSRIDNFTRLASNLAKVGVHPLVPLGEVDVPQVFAIRDSDNRCAMALVQAGVVTYEWPGCELPYEVRHDAKQFETDICLADEILCIPVHQDITARQIDHIAKLLQNVLAHGEGQ